MDDTNVTDTGTDASAEVKESGGSTYVEVIIDEVTMNHMQYEELLASTVAVKEEITASTEKLNNTITHGITFLILLCIFQFYGLLRRASKKGGV